MAERRGADDEPGVRATGRLSRRAVLRRAGRGLAVAVVAGAGGLLAACRGGGAPTPTAAGTPGTPAASPRVARTGATPATPVPAPPVPPTATATTEPSPTPTASPAPSPTSPAAAISGSPLRLLHAAPDAPELAFTVDGRALFALGYTDISRHQALAAGQHRLQATVAGTGTVAVDLPLNLQEGRAYTVAVANALGQLDALLLEDDLTPPAPDQVRLRVLHAAADAPVVDVEIAGGPVVAAGLAYQATSAYTSLAAGVYTFAVRAAGAAEAGFSTRALTLQAGDIYTGVLLGQSASNTLRLIVYPDND
jgi:hypothetical protein